VESSPLWPLVDILKTQTHATTAAAIPSSATRTGSRTSGQQLANQSNAIGSAWSRGADEIVLAELGELGPLDAQFSGSSALAPFKLLEQVADAVGLCIRRTRKELQSGQAKGDGGKEAAAVAEAIVRSALSPIDALRIAALASHSAASTARAVLRSSTSTRE